MSELSASVGLAGVNRHLDVAFVQRLLVGRHVPTGPVDGRCGRLTIGAIVDYQRRFMHEPDGRVDVRGPTWRRLHNTTSDAHPLHAHPESLATAPSNPQRPAVPAAQSAPTATPLTASPEAIFASPSAAGVHYTDHLPLPPPGTVNVGLVSPPNSLLESRFGKPRDGFTADCQPATNARVAAAIVT